MGPKLLSVDELAKILSEGERETFASHLDQLKKLADVVLKLSENQIDGFGKHDTAIADLNRRVSVLETAADAGDAQPCGRVNRCARKCDVCKVDAANGTHSEHGAVCTDCEAAGGPILNPSGESEQPTPYGIPSEIADTLGDGGKQVIEALRENIFAAIRGLVMDFAYYDRENDDSLSNDTLTIRNLREAVKNRVITVDEMTAHFKAQLELAFPPSKIS